MQKLNSRKPLLDQRGVKQAGKNVMPNEPVLNSFFYENFNIRPKILSKDTCNICDELRVQLINANRRGQNVSDIQEKKRMHLSQAETARSQMKADINLSKTSEDIECITFDMEKTLPLPRLQTNLIFYKRQLWFYNLGVHSGHTGQSYCYTWVEGVAGRGAQEVGSCLMKHIRENVKPSVKHLILWSDSCGGQNRNIKIILLMKSVLEVNPNLETITFKYLMPGHSYLPNDKDFGDIEKGLKFNQQLYTPEEYREVLRLCRRNKPLILYEMDSEQFYSCENIENKITNRKKFIDKKPVNWLRTRQIKLQKVDPFLIYMRSDFQTEEYECLNIQKKSTHRTSTNQVITRQSCRRPRNVENENKEVFSFNNLLTPLWPNGKTIAQPKLVDIRSLLHLIPNDAHQFYDALTGSTEIVDDVDGLNSNLDFELEDLE
ncbi:hypothetical protein ACJJTC_010395 [Scirpophaga incertulas]